MKAYMVYDMNTGLFSEDIIIEANSPLQAAQIYVKREYGKNVTRTTYKNPQIIVYGPRASYVYDIV